MPFEIPQKSPEVETQVGRFQKFANAMLAGCMQTTPGFGAYLDAGRACALGAWMVGSGALPVSGCAIGLKPAAVRDEVTAMEAAYHAKYGSEIVGDNDNGLFTREEIAARIAAL